MTKADRKRLYRSRAWAAARAEVLALAGLRCQRCGAVGRLEVHHVRPLHVGGAPLDVNNLQALCRRCHFRTEPGRTPAIGTAWREEIDAAQA